MLKSFLMSSLLLSSAVAMSASLQEIPSHLNIEDFSGNTYSAIEAVDAVKITINKEIIIGVNRARLITDGGGYGCMLVNNESQKIVLNKGQVLSGRGEFRRVYLDWSNLGEGKEFSLRDANKNEFLLQCGSLNKGHSAYYYGEGADSYRADMKECNTHHGMVTESEMGPAVFREATTAEKLQDLAFGTVKYVNGMSGVSRSKGYYFKCAHYPHKISDIKETFAEFGMNLDLLTVK
ncbi:hypothetical protein DOM21_02045 [Bacteriovorax stolpii]|uniref:Uncharacterized protein n=1 Tax=Bacteriovorax stolpii TaxID=960 RepID=A0A2K9NW61_BACTC|nr:hypothetical protein [Bacteriovorax stolpii]AUN99751.1 hypothetical protein C0V70_16880 [Bacteriovorax stolpii]QDK40255.1 hypothetical protein DOM21_02045 [Bacteriovorax stolpii]TDP54362.1 hypothetical protein C8D79_1659 [Bacteriovorax stolpii]